MIVHVYTTVRNEAYMMPYFLRHYSTFANRIFVLDDDSTDGTREIVAENPRAVCLPYPGTKGLNEEEIAQIYEEACLTYSIKADWVMFPDVDEMLYHPEIRRQLMKMRDLRIRAVKSTGFLMVASAPPHGPGQIYDTVKTGIRSRRYDKTIILHPRLRFALGHGRHTVDLPPGTGVRRCGIRLLHYCYLGLPYIEARIQKNFGRMDATPAELDYRLRRARWTFNHAWRDMETVL